MSPIASFLSPHMAKVKTDVGRSMCWTLSAIKPDGRGWKNRQSCVLSCSTSTILNPLQINNIGAICLIAVMIFKKICHHLKTLGSYVERSGIEFSVFSMFLMWIMQRFRLLSWLSLHLETVLLVSPDHTAHHSGNAFQQALHSCVFTDVLLWMRPSGQDTIRTYLISDTVTSKGISCNLRILIFRPSTLNARHEPLCNSAPPPCPYRFHMTCNLFETCPRYLAMWLK